MKAHLTKTLSVRLTYGRISIVQTHRGTLERGLGVGQGLHLLKACLARLKQRGLELMAANINTCTCVNISISLFLSVNSACDLCHL